MSFESNFYQWLNTFLLKSASKPVKGYSFNLYEADSFRIELAAISDFDNDDLDWACKTSFHSKKMSIPKKYSGEKWSSCLEKMQNLVKEYLCSNELGAEILNKAERVGIGFVDGDLILLKDDSLA